jgi:TonB dependent receptor
MPVRVTGSNSSPRLGGFAGFDPGEDSPHSVYFLRDTGLDGQNNRRTTDIADGMHPVSTSIGAEVSFELEGGWSISDKFRVSKNSGRFVSPFPAEVASAAAIAPTIGGDGARLIYANGPNAGQAYGGLVIRTHLFNTEINDFGNTINDLQLAKSFELPSANLDLRLGYYKSRQSIDMDWTWNSYLQELSGDDAALLDVVDRNGALRSDGGLYAYGVPFWGNCCQRNYDTDYDIDAPYVALSYTNEKLTVDASVRHDSGQGQGTYAGTLQASNFDVDGDGVISAPERSVSLIDRGNPSSVNYDWSYTSFSVGANYLFTRDLAGFARISQGGRANADRLLFGLVRPDGSVREEDAVDEVELGAKWRGGRLCPGQQRAGDARVQPGEPLRAARDHPPPEPPGRHQQPLRRVRPHRIGGGLDRGRAREHHPRTVDPGALGHAQPAARLLSATRVSSRDLP